MASMKTVRTLPIWVWLPLSIALLVTPGLALATAGSPASAAGADVAPSHPGDSTGDSFRPRRHETTSFGNGVLNLATRESFVSLQDAIDDPDTADGNTLEVVAPVLPEGQVVISKSLTLQGATGTEVIQMTVDTGSAGDDRGWFVVQPGVDLQVRDLTFDGNGFQVFQAFRHQGTGSFEDCHFRDIQFNAAGPDYQGTAIVAFGGNVDIRRSLFEQIGRVGVFLFGNGVFGASIEDNLYLGKGDGDFLDYGFEVGGGAVADFRGNHVTNCRGIASADGSTSAGFLASTLFGAGTAMTVRGNIAVDNHSALVVGTPGDTSVVQAELNQFAGNIRGLRSDSPSTLAENNWWGCNAGPNALGCDTAVGTADFEPWIVLGIEAAPASIPVGGTAQIIADLRKNSDGAGTAALGTLPDGIPAAFAATGGGVSPSLGATTAGTATSTYNAGSTPGIETASVTVDNQTVFVDVEVQATSLPTLWIESEIGARPNSTVEVPVELMNSGGAVVAVAFSVDYDETCLAFDPTDADGNGLPDAISFPLAGNPDPPVLNVLFDASDSDGELDFAIADFSLPFTALPDGPLVSVRFETICAPAPGSSQLAPMLFSSDPEASFGNASGQSLDGTTQDGSVRIFGTLAGDCNGDGSVGASDLSACTLEAFDGDGNFWLDTPGGTFPGNPAGCDANEDTIVDAGDLSCKVLILFNGQGACNTPGLASELGAAGPALGIPDVATAGEVVQIPIFFDPGSHGINGLFFAIELDPELLSFDSTDGDGDGIPDALHLFTGAQTTVLAAVAEDPGELTIGLLDPFSALVDSPQLLATIELSLLSEVLPPKVEIRFSQEPAPSFGSLGGQSIPGETTDGAILTDAIFIDGFESGDASRWTTSSAPGR